MDLWWRAAGFVRLRLTSADCACRLRMLAAEVDLEQIEFQSDLTVEFSVRKSDLERIKVGGGEKLEILERRGIGELGKRWKRWPVLGAILILITVLTVFLPTRILFIRVEGNGDIPARLILQEAESCGVCFGASRRELRSEQVKNHLLYAIPQLRWAGVNTSGCVATITVSVRTDGEEEGETVPGSIVAVRDAVVTEVTASAGTALVTPGQAVTRGQTLISGYTDLGITTRADRAAGEVYGLTSREIRAVLPAETHTRTENGEMVRKFSLLIGKNRINLYSGSGILHTSCVKMRKINWLTLPGGFQLPVALVEESYELCDLQKSPRTGGEELLLDAARRTVQGSMVAGEILSEDHFWGENVLDAVFESREMIGRFQPGELLEGDTNDDRKNGERGAG